MRNTCLDIMGEKYRLNNLLKFEILSNITASNIFANVLFRPGDY